MYWPCFEWYSIVLVYFLYSLDVAIVGEVAVVVEAVVVVAVSTIKVQPMIKIVKK